MNSGVIEMDEAVLEAVRSHARRVWPEECCGILLGLLRDGAARVSDVRASENLASADERRRRYVIDPRHLLAAERDAQALGHVVVGYYHSHPNHPAVPSATDIAEGWPGVAYVIVSVDGDGQGEVRAWEFDGEAREIEIELV